MLIRKTDPLPGFLCLDLFWCGSHSEKTHRILAWSQRGEYTRAIGSRADLQPAVRAGKAPIGTSVFRTLLICETRPRRDPLRCLASSQRDE